MTEIEDYPSTVADESIVPSVRTISLKVGPTCQALCGVALGKTPPLPLTLRAGGGRRRASGQLLLRAGEISADPGPNVDTIRTVWLARREQKGRVLLGGWSSRVA